MATTIKVPVAKRDQLNKWLNERGLKLTPWFKMIVKKEILRQVVS